jgi:hypothetical protein
MRKRFGMITKPYSWCLSLITSCIFIHIYLHLYFLYFLYSLFWFFPPIMKRCHIQKYFSSLDYYLQ